MRSKYSRSCFLLCAVLWVSMLAGCPGCRRQGSHAVSIEVKEESGSDPVSEPTSSEGSDIIFKDWISTGESAHALSGQLLLTLTSAGFDYGKRGYTGSLRIRFSDKEEEAWSGIAAGGRKTVEFESVEYMIDVLEVDQGRAHIAVVRKR